jgi:hypothetical protein
MKRTVLVRAMAGLLGAIAALAAVPQKANAGVFIGVGVSVGVPPPPLPIYDQPPIPGPGYIWTPGYWAWDGNEYYWVPGTWVTAPFYGALWTPGYWGWNGGAYIFHRGYWGYHVGFYGGINYGWGYPGSGYVGGHWGHGGFYYNRAANRFGGMHVTHVYDQAVVHHGTRISYNGGRGGVAARATPRELSFARQARMGPIAAQQRQMNLASHDPAFRVSANHGVPPVAATQRPGTFARGGMTDAHGGRFSPGATNVQRMNNAVVHAPQQHAPMNNMALHSANFAPHAGTANMTRPSGSFSNLHRPGGVAGVAPSMHPMHSVNARPMNGYRAPAAAPAFRPQQYRMHAPAAPQYHAYRPAPAAHPGGGAPRGGGGHDNHHR